MKLNLSEILTEPLFKFNVLKNCYECQQRYKSLTFDFLLPIEESQTLIMIAITYNSYTKPNLLLKINSKLVHTNFLNQATQSQDKIMCLRMEAGPYLMYQGTNKIELWSGNLFPDIYNIEIYPYVKNRNQTISTFSYKMSDFVYLNTYNIYGGFFWHLNNFLIMCHFCETFNKIPIVNFDAGLFVNNTSIENTMIKENSNWFFNYFQNYSEVSPSVYQSVICHPKKVKINIQSIKNYRKYNKFCNENIVLEFKRDGFDWSKKNFYDTKAYRKLIPKYLKVLPHIEKIKLEMLEKYFPKPAENQKFIGIHYRGTDKIEEELNPEQHPKHYSYQKIYEMLVNKARDLIEVNSKYDIYIVACSDELPFLTFLKKKLNRKLIYYEEAIRSNITTSDLQEDFTKIPNRNKDVELVSLTSQQLDIYKKRKKLIDNSIHLGNKNVSNYKKGLDCLLDCFLLEKVDVLYKSKGNFSLFCEYLNQKENLESIYIHEVI